MVAGAGLSVLGGVVAQVLRNSQESRTWRRSVLAERMSHVSQFMSACLDFADLVCTPYQLGAEGTWGETDWQWWGRTMGELGERLQGLPAGGSSIVMYVDDHELMTVLGKMAKVTATIWVWSRFPGRGMAIPSEVVDRRDELKEMASEGRARIDQLVKKAR
jgi:hypothetical protein